MSSSSKKVDVNKMKHLFYHDGRVYLNDSCIDNAGARIIGDKIKGNKFVKSLYLGRNNIGDDGAQYIGEALKLNQLITFLDLSFNEIGNDGAQAIGEALSINRSIRRLNLSHNKINITGVQSILDALKVNINLVNIQLTGNHVDNQIIDSLKWYTTCNRACQDLKLGIKERDSVPKTIFTDDAIYLFLTQIKRDNTQLEPIMEQSSETDDLEKESNFKKKIAKDLLEKAFNLLDQEKHIEAKCYLEIANNLDPTSVSNIKRMEEIREEIKERDKLSEHELQMRVEKRINEIKEDIMHAEHQAQRIKTQEEREMIEKQIAVLREQETRMKEQIEAYEARYQKLQERENKVERLELILNEQTLHLERLLAELIQIAPEDACTLQHQMSEVVLGDKNVDAARMRFESLQKTARSAQQALVAEERRQRERVEWLQKQMDLYKVKGMSPEQKTFRNFLKDVKRLSSVRHQLEHTPHPLKCFISYAWETDMEANQELQKRLQRLKEDLETAGMEVKLDIHDMKYDMKKFMKENIEKAHKLLLVCTPRLQIRAAETTENNLQHELQAALEKQQHTPDFITPLLFSGTFSTSLPPQFSHLFSLSFTPDVDYHSALASLSPMGLIPMLLGLEKNKDYKRIQERMEMELEEYKKAKV